MARKRMLDPDFFIDEEISALSPHARLLYQGMWCICDDNHATLPNKPLWIKSQIFPYENIDPARLLIELYQSGKIVLFHHEGKEYWYIKNFFKHQTIDRPSKPKYPEFKREKEVGNGLFEGLKSTKLSTLDEHSTSTRPEIKEVKEIKEEFSSKRRGPETGDKSLMEMKRSLAKSIVFKTRP